MNISEKDLNKLANIVANKIKPQFDDFEKKFEERFEKWANLVSIRFQKIVKPFITQKEACEIMGILVGTVEKHKRNAGVKIDKDATIKDIPDFNGSVFFYKKLDNGRILIHKDSYQKYLESRGY